MSEQVRPEQIVRVDPAKATRLEAVDALLLDVREPVERNAKAAARLADAGIDVRILAGGGKAWTAGGAPVRRDDGQPGTVV